MKGPIPLRFSSEVVVNLRELKLSQHTEPLVFIGADVLRPPGLELSIHWGGPGLPGPYQLCPRQENMNPAPTASSPSSQPEPPTNACNEARITGTKKTPQLAPQMADQDPKLSELIDLVKGQGWCL